MELGDFLLEALVHNVLVLASELVVGKIDTRLFGRLGLELLAICVHLRGVGRVGEALRAVAVAHVHVAKLLGSEIEELLLELLLALGKVDLGGQELRGDVGIDLTIVELELRRREDLVVHDLLLTKLVGAAEAGSDGSLGHGLLAAAVVGLPGVAAIHIVLVLAVRGGCGRLGGRGRLGGGAEASEEVGPAGARRLDLGVLGDGSHLGRRGHAEAFERGALAARGEAGTGHAEAAVGLEVVVSHLSKTASVHAHGIVGEVRNRERVRLQQAMRQPQQSRIQNRR